MNADQKAKLKKLADHLIGGRLGHEKFDFRHWNILPEGHTGPLNVCGTSGCAIGECPIVFPDDWEFDELGVPVLRDLQWGWGSPRTSAVSFFGLTRDEADLLFLPVLLGDPRPGRLPGDSTAAEVGQNILRFLETKEITE